MSKIRSLAIKARLYKPYADWMRTIVATAFCWVVWSLCLAIAVVALYIPAAWLFVLAFCLRYICCHTCDWLSEGRKL